MTTQASARLIRDYEFGLPELKLIKVTAEKSTEPNTPVIKIYPISDKRVIESSDGQDFIAGVPGRFAYVDRDFEFFGLNTYSPATAETSLEVLDFNGDCPLHKIFYRISNNLEKIIISQTQIIQFCKKYPEDLSRKYANFFITRVELEYFVIRLYYLFDGFHFHVSPLRDKQNYWSYDNCRPRFVLKKRLPAEER